MLLSSMSDVDLVRPCLCSTSLHWTDETSAGILSMFAAKAGAKKVYAVDASAVAFKAERNIKANGLSDVITFVPPCPLLTSY